MAPASQSYNLSDSVIYIHLCCFIWLVEVFGHGRGMEILGFFGSLFVIFCSVILCTTAWLVCKLHRQKRWKRDWNFGMISWKSCNPCFGRFSCLLNKICSNRLLNHFLHVVFVNILGTLVSLLSLLSFLSFSSLAFLVSQLSFLLLLSCLSLVF